MSDDKTFLPRRNRGHAQLLSNLLKYLECFAVARPKFLPPDCCTLLPGVPRLKVGAQNLPGQDPCTGEPTLLSNPTIQWLTCLLCARTFLLFWNQLFLPVYLPCRCVKTSPSTGLYFPTNLTQSLIPGRDNGEIKFTRVQNRFYPDQISQS